MSWQKIHIFHVLDQYMIAVRHVGLLPYILERKHESYDTYKFVFLSIIIIAYRSLQLQTNLKT